MIEIVKRNELHRRSPQMLERRAHLRLDQPLPLPPPQQRLRASYARGRRLRPPRHDPPYAPPIDSLFIANRNFPDRL